MNVNNDPSLSLLSALRPNSPQSQAPRTQQSTPTDLLPKPNRTGLPPAATATAPEQPTIDGLLEAWGGKSEMYDLDGDGGVNMRDLVALLKSMSGRPDSLPTEVQPVDPPPVTAGTDLVSTLPTIEPTQLAPQEPETLPTQLAPQEPDTPPTQLADPVEDPDVAENITMRDLLAAWGTSDAEFDLNADGTVNMRDVVQLLRDMNTASPPGTDLESENPMTISGLLEQWGRNDDSRYDLDGNGTVNMRDLVDMLGRLADSGGPPPLGTNLAGQTEQATFGGLRPIAASLVDRLRTGGFDDHPPANIHALVGKLNLTDAQQKELLSHVNTEYPRGLGISLVG